jgi:hypothetical protein
MNADVYARQVTEALLLVFSYLIIKMILVISSVTCLKRKNKIQPYLTIIDRPK